VRKAARFGDGHDVADGAVVKVQLAWIAAPFDGHDGQVSLAKGREGVDWSASSERACQAACAPLTRDGWVSITIRRDRHQREQRDNEP
jgi:hypothetical protein